MALIKADDFVIDSNDALEFKLIRRPSDLEDDDTTFKPEMSHQVFGESESIFGYKNLKIKLYYSAARMTTYLGTTYSRKVDPKIHDGCQPDDIIKKLSEVLQQGFCTNIDDFCSDLEKDASFKPFGELKHSFAVTGENSKKRTYEIYACDVTTPGFLAYHERVQTFILWYIDAASFIDTDDEGWRFFFMYEKYSFEGSPMYAFIGFATTFEYYAYPNNIRPRISQMLILPPFQRQGLAAELLRSIYHHYKGNEKIIDITVEDPSEDFQRLRDFVDSQNCAGLESFQKVHLLKGFTNTMAAEAQSKLMLSKKQARRVYEILRLKATNLSDKEEYRNYRLNIKKRLNAPHQKQKSMLDKLQLVLKPQEYQAAMSVNMASDEQRQDNLEQDYQELLTQYRQVLERISNI